MWWEKKSKHSSMTAASWLFSRRKYRIICIIGWMRSSIGDCSLWKNTDSLEAFLLIEEKTMLVKRNQRTPWKFPFNCFSFKYQHWILVWVKEWQYGKNLLLLESWIFFKKKKRRWSTQIEGDMSILYFKIKQRNIFPPSLLPFLPPFSSPSFLDSL